MVDVGGAALLIKVLPHEAFHTGEMERKRFRTTCQIVSSNLYANIGVSVPSNARVRVRHRF